MTSRGRHGIRRQMSTATPKVQRKRVDCGEIAVNSLPVDEKGKTPFYTKSGRDRGPSCLKMKRTNVKGVVCLRNKNSVAINQLSIIKRRQGIMMIEAKEIAA